MIDLDDGVRLVHEAPTVLAEVTQMHRFSGTLVPRCQFVERLNRGHVNHPTLG